MRKDLRILLSPGEGLKASRAQRFAASQHLGSCSALRNDAAPASPPTSTVSPIPSTPSTTQTTPAPSTVPAPSTTPRPSPLLTNGHPALEKRPKNAKPTSSVGISNRLPEFSLAKKVIIVSGAARGLGLTQAEALLEAGAIGEPAGWPQNEIAVRYVIRGALTKSTQPQCMRLTVCQSQ